MSWCPLTLPHGVKATSQGQSMKTQVTKSQDGAGTRRSLLSLQPAHCPHHPFLLLHWDPTAKERPHPVFLRGLTQTPYPPGPCSSSYRSADDPPAMGHQATFQKQKQPMVKRQPAQTSFLNNASAGERGWGGGVPTSCSQGAWGAHWNQRPGWAQTVAQTDRQAVTTQ